MTNKPYLVKCLSSRYDAEQKILVLLCLFEETGEQKIVHFGKSDFHFKNPGNEVPDNEMFKTADMFRGKRFKLVVQDDPNRNLTADNKPQLERKMIESAFDQEILQGKLNDLILDV